jgi:hypothetical protein
VPEEGERDGAGVIELPWPPSSLSGHSDKHYRVMRPIIAKHREWARRATLAASVSVRPDGDIRVSATFYPPDRRSDRVNLPARLKPYWDGIADALKVNDRRFLPAYHFAEPVENPRVVVTIEGAAI